MQEKYLRKNGKEVKELRERTNAEMQDCIDALIETNGDLELAMGILLKRSVAKYGIPY